MTTKNAAKTYHTALRRGWTETVYATSADLKRGAVHLGWLDPEASDYEGWFVVDREALAHNLARMFRENRSIVRGSDGTFADFTIERDGDEVSIHETGMTYSSVKMTADEAVRLLAALEA